VTSRDQDVPCGCCNILYLIAKKPGLEYLCDCDPV
jgi:hypothetical protein